MKDAFHADLGAERGPKLYEEGAPKEEEKKEEAQPEVTMYGNEGDDVSEGDQRRRNLDAETSEFVIRSSLLEREGREEREKSRD